MHYNLADLRLLTLPEHADESGRLVVMQAEDDIPFAVERIFVVTAGAGVTRGRHAHKRCSQVLVCLHGACEVTCTDGDLKKTVRLEGARHGLVIPPSIWAEQIQRACKSGRRRSSGKCK